MAFDDMLNRLNRRQGEYTAVCHRALHGQFHSSVVESENAMARVESLPEPVDVWFSVNPTAGPVRVGGGRGGSEAVTRWAALVLDVDVKESGFLDLEEAHGFVDAVSALIHTRPSVVIHSGHGLQPVWPLENCDLRTEEDLAKASVLSRRFDRLARMVASDSSAHMDNVSDLARVIRVPGTTNWKDTLNPVPVYAVSDSGGPLTVDQIGEFLDEWAPEIASDKPVLGPVVSPTDSWKFGQDTCAYVTAMVRSWSRASDEPLAGRHQWAMTRCVRLAAAHRVGCISSPGLQDALRILETALAHWCQLICPPRDLAPHEIGSAYRWAEAKVASFPYLRAQAELGHHRHVSTSARRWRLEPR